MQVIFFGTPWFAANILISLLENGVKILAVVTKPDKPRGRSGKAVFSQVKQVVTEKYPHLPLYQPDLASDPCFAKKLKEYESDLFVVIAYGEIIKENLLKIPRHGCINLHPSLLPKYRGPSPIHFTLLNGDREAGVSVIEMVKKMDAGDILAQEKVSISSSLNFDALESILCQMGGKVLLEVIDQYAKGTVCKTAQDKEQATYVTKVDPSCAHIDWDEEAEHIHNKIRAFSPRPGAWCDVETGGHVKRLKIFCSKIQESSSGKPRESLLYQKGEWVVACKRGALQLLEVQLEGKKRLSTLDFIRGLPIPPSFCVPS